MQQEKETVLNSEYGKDTWGFIIGNKKAELGVSGCKIIKRTLR